MTTDLLDPPTSVGGLASLTATPRRRVAVIAIGALVAVLVGVLIGVASTRPTYPGDGSVEVGFARDMSTHHAQAVQMGMIAAENATLPVVRSYGADVALTQQAQIGIMQTWLTTWGASPTSDAAPMSWMTDGASLVKNGLMPGMATDDELKALQNATGTQVDILYLQYMIRHHLGGAHMIDAVLADPHARPEVRDLAQKMKNTQGQEVTNMLDVLENQLGAQPLS